VKEVSFGAMPKRARRRAAPIPWELAAAAAGRTAGSSVEVTEYSSLFLVREKPRSEPLSVYILSF
jgi:hypothetical protein